MEKQKIIYHFEQYLDEVYGNPGTPYREALQKKNNEIASLLTKE